jgi:predicted outer membrane repeat protein
MRTLVVNASGTGDFPTIQAAVDVAWTLDTVELLDGTYTGNGNRDIDFNGKAIEVRSQSGNPEACIIDCQADFYDKHRGFYLHSGEAALSKITGLTIKNGYTTDAGGAILCHGASPAISNCIIDSCISYLDGGGISYWSAPGRPSLDSCVFKNNHTYGEWGGGVCCLSSDVDISDCIFMGNTIDFPAEGGGLGLVESESHVMRCTFYANETDPADPRGSAIYWYDCTPIIENTIMAFGIGGPPMYSHGDSVATLICCDLYGNEGGDWTGSIASQYGTNGNIWEDPRFCNPVAGNLTLHLSSPCAAPNNPGCGQIGALGIGCGPETYVVNSVGTGDFPTIQAAVDVAWDGDVVELVDGTYTGDGNRDIYMKNKAITLRSQSGNASSCVIDAEGSSGDNHQVMVISGPSHAPTYIEDITITGGWTSGYGGGVLCFGGRLSFSGCVFSNDSTFATEGGGLYMDSGTLTVTECLFNANSAGVGDGGAIYSGSGTTIVNSEFSSNVASNGSAIRASGSGLEIRGCDFHDHTSSTGGVVYLPVTSGEVTGCTFYQNSTDYGALQIYEGMPLISECTFTGNSGGAYGCAVLAWETEAEISQCTLAKNNCTSGSLIYSTGSKQPTISSCIMAFNTGAVPVSCADSFPSLACCDIYENELGDWVGCIAGQFGNNGNIRMDPLFCNPDSGDFTLYLESPCMADSAPPGCPRLGAHDVGCSSGAGVERPEPDLQDQLTLSQAVPNPFSGTTEIRYLIPSGHEASNVTLGVYDPTGRKVRTLVNSNQAPGAYRIAWDATNQGGGRAASGVYFLRISWNGQSQTRRVVLLR